MRTTRSGLIQKRLSHSSAGWIVPNPARSAFCARWIGACEAVPRDLPRAVDLLKDKKLLIGLRQSFAGRMDLHRSRGIRPRQHPLGGHLLDFSDIEFHPKRNGVEDGVVCLADSGRTDA